jgi:sulfur carrier protein ThiS|tara:strand:+ start:1970 stop:2173 length:204 start_codon:yes stop_codon:yes gene_type:complete
MMKIALKGHGHDHVIELEAGSTVKQALIVIGIHPSTVIVSHEDVVLPHTTVLNADVSLELTIVSSGG